jgi:hypothetical protein
MGDKYYPTPNAMISIYHNGIHNKTRDIDSSSPAKEG